MSSQLKLRRGSTVSHAGFTGAEGEVTYDTNKKCLVAHDGVTAGGHPAVKQSDITASTGAALIGNTPAGTVAATTVQGAIDELDTEKLAAADLAASSGASLVGYMPAGAGAVATTVQTKLRESVSVLDFIPTSLHAGIAAGTNTTPLHVYIQAAIDSVCPLVGGLTTAGSVYFPRGKYLVTTTLNLTNSRVGGTLIRDNLCLHGDSRSSVIVGETGNGHAIADVTGSQWLTLSYLSFVSGNTNKSTVGIYQGLASVLQQTQNQRFVQVAISMHDDAAANGGYGTIGIWNFGAEENTYDTCYVTANTAFVGTTQVNVPVGTYANPFLAQAAVHSLGVTTFSGENFLVSLNRRSAPVILLGPNSMDFQNTYISNIGAGGTNNDAIRFYSSCSGISYNGTIEQLGTLHNLDTILTSKFKIVFGGIADSSAPIINLERGSAGIIIGSEFQIYNADPSSATRNLFKVTPVGANEQVSCYIQSSTFKTNLPVSYTGLNENLLWNPKTTDVNIYGSDWRYEIDNRKHRLSFQDYTLGTTGTTTELCKVLMPTAVANTSAGGLGIKIDGVVGTEDSGDNSRTTGYLQSLVCVSTSQNGVITYGTASTTFSNAANANAGGNALTGVAVSVTAATVATNVAIKLTPTITGVNGGTASFTGVVEMLWSGWNSVAPSLLLSGQAAP